jgi:hypothetical protein
MRRKEKKKIVPAPPCDCECVRCDIGSHCGKTPLCHYPVWKREIPKPRKET